MKQKINQKSNKKDIILYTIVSLQFLLLVLFFIKANNGINNLKRALMLNSIDISILQYKVACLEGSKDHCGEGLKLAEQAKKDFNKDFSDKKVIEPWYRLSY